REKHQPLGVTRNRLELHLEHIVAKARHALDDAEEEIPRDFQRSRARRVEPGKHRRDIDHLARMIVPLRLIAFEQAWAGETAQYRGQLPSKIRRVAQARIHSLSEKRWLEVRGITRQENP